MRIRVIALAACLSFGVVAIAGEKPPPKVPAALAGQPYAKARKEILRAGWHRDFRQSAFVSEREKQRVYPELRFCAVDHPWCFLYFKARGHCLRVIAQGENVSDFTVLSVETAAAGEKLCQ